VSIFRTRVERRSDFEGCTGTDVPGICQFCGRGEATDDQEAGHQDERHEYEGQV